MPKESVVLAALVQLLVKKKIITYREYAEEIRRIKRGTHEQPRRSEDRE